MAKYHEENCPEHNTDWITPDWIGFQQESVKSEDSNEESTIMWKYTPPNNLQGTIGQQENEIDKDMQWKEGYEMEMNQLNGIPKFIPPPMYTPKLMSMGNQQDPIAFSEFRQYGDYTKNYLVEKAALKKFEKEKERASGIDICLNDMVLPISRLMQKRSIDSSSVKNIIGFKQPQSRGKIKIILNFCVIFMILIIFRKRKGNFKNISFKNKENS